MLARLETGLGPKREMDISQRWWLAAQISTPGARPAHLARAGRSIQRVTLFMAHIQARASFLLLPLLCLRVRGSAGPLRRRRTACLQIHAPLASPDSTRATRACTTIATHLGYTTFRRNMSRSTDRNLRGTEELTSTIITGDQIRRGLGYIHLVGCTLRARRSKGLTAPQATYQGD